jgi:hypothetical protein
MKGSVSGLAMAFAGMSAAAVAVASRDIGGTLAGVSDVAGPAEPMRHAPVVISRTANGNLRGTSKAIAKSIRRRHDRARAGRYAWP